MGNKAASKLANAGGFVAPAGKRSADCKAFNAAAKKWCKETRQHRKKLKEWKNKPPPKGPKPEMKPRKFNDYFYDALGKENKDMALRTQREVPFIKSGSKTGTRYRSAAEFAQQRAGTLEGQAAQQMQDTWADAARSQSTRGGGHWDGARHAMRQDAKGLGAGNRDFYPDGVRDGELLEIKGPGDREGPNQFKKYAKASPNGKVRVISPQNCGTKGMTAGGRCKAAA